MSDEKEYRRLQVLAADRESADLGLLAARTAVLVNAGAVVAILALVGQLWGARDEALAAVIAEAHWFFWGLVLALATILAGYVFVELKSERERDKAYSDAPPDTDRLTAVEWWALVVAALSLASYTAFAVGAWRTLDAFAIGLEV